MVLGMTAAPQGPVEEVRMWVGDIAVCDHWIVTPTGTVKAQEATWQTTPMWQNRRVLPTWAVVMAICTFWIFLLGLLFLLVREERAEGTIQVTVTAPGFMHLTYLPVRSAAEAAQHEASVAKARQLAIMAA